MTKDELKRRSSSNIKTYRKSKGYTQVAPLCAKIAAHPSDERNHRRTADLCAAWR